MRQDGYMEQNTEELRKHPEPPDPNQDAGQSEQNPTVRTDEGAVSGQSAPSSDDPEIPPASETWVEGQPESNADYPK
jgi:hypothetical protein